MESTEKATAIDTDGAWRKLKARLEEDELIPPQRNSQQLGNYPLWIKLAASVLILVVAGSLVYFGMPTADKTRITALYNGPEDLTLVKTLEDGSVVYLASNSSISYPDGFSKDERRIKVEGEVFFDVTPNAHQPFRVETGNTLIEVVGTAFSVKAFDTRHVEISVEEGLVKVNTGTQQMETIFVSPGEILHLRDDSFHKISSNHLLLSLWRLERMHFRDENLSDIISVINRNYQSKLILGDSAIGERQLTVTFYNNSFQTIIELICLSMNLEATLQADSSIVLVSRK